MMRCGYLHPEPDDHVACTLIYQAYECDLMVLIAFAILFGAHSIDPEVSWLRMPPGIARPLVRAQISQSLIQILGN